jgi:hypothetical protein
MKILSMIFALTLVLALAACGGKKGGSTTPDTTTTNTGDATGGTTGDGQPCTQEVMLECPEGQIDACMKNPPEGETHTCVAQ